MLIHRPASMVDGSWIGREVLVGTDVTGVLSDVEQHPTHHRTVLYLSGRRVDVREDTTVTFDGLGLMGGR